MSLMKAMFDFGPCANCVVLSALFLQATFDSGKPRAKCVVLSALFLQAPFDSGFHAFNLVFGLVLFLMLWHLMESVLYWVFAQISRPSYVEFCKVLSASFLKATFTFGSSE
jgi:hypothetical protein